MKELTNNDIYEFISEELSCYPELPHYSVDELRDRENDRNFWNELSEQLDCFTLCDMCSKPMIEGYIMSGSHYCSETCLYKDYTKEQVEHLYSDNNDECYFTRWYEDSVSYNK